MQQIIEQVNQIRELSGNEQLDFIKSVKSDILEEVLDYTYNPDKMYKIDTGKYNKIKMLKGLIPRKKKEVFTVEDWHKFTEILDSLVEKRAVTESGVKSVKYFITDFVDIDTQSFLCMVLYKDLRLNLGIKKIQTIWPEFCDKPQVQLAEDYDGTYFENGLYSRKFDGKRMYIMDGVACSRSNKPCKVAPIQHILDQLKDISMESTFDGEVLYFEKGGKEDFKKATSLTGSDDRTEECDNLYYVIFDGMITPEFKNKKANMEFKFIYDILITMFDAKPSERFGYSVLDTKYPNILIARQDSNKDELDKLRQANNWEGLMYRNGDAPYEFRRSKNILKIKDMKDGEFTIHSLSEGTGKNEGRLGALNIFYKDSFVGVGSGFTDEERQLIWDNSKIFLSKPFAIAFDVKVQYFEETVDSKGIPSLRFPVFLCFRHTDSKDEMTVTEVLEFCKERISMRKGVRNE